MRLWSALASDSVYLELKAAFQSTTSEEDCGLDVFIVRAYIGYDRRPDTEMLVPIPRQP